MKKLDRAGNWKHCPTKKWPYKGLDDPKYIKDRDALLKENGMQIGKKVLIKVKKNY